jgi:hypothetical protein
MDVGSIWVTIGANVDGLVNGLHLSKKELIDWKNTTNENTKDLASWGAALAATAAPLIGLGYVIHTEINKYGTMAQKLSDLSTTTGITTGKLQDLQYAALLSGTNTEKLSLALNTMTVSMGDAASGKGAAWEAFMGLGIDPRGRTPDEVFDDIATSLHEIKDPAEKAAAAQNIFGKSYKEMIPFMEEYITNKDEIARHKTFSDEDLQSMKEAKVGWDKLYDSLNIFEGKLFIHLGTLQKVIDKYNIVAKVINKEPIDLGASAEGILNTATMGQYGQLKTATSGNNVNITINNPQGTTAENVAAIQRASEMMAFMINMGGP